MNITTELNPGERGFFLADNEVISDEVITIKVEANINSPEPEVRYEVFVNGDRQFVPAHRAAKTKEELLKKL